MVRVPMIVVVDLIFDDHLARRQEFQVGEKATVGRDEVCAICLLDEVVSGTHATLSFREDEIAIEDTSRNGTTLRESGKERTFHRGQTTIRYDSEVLIGASKIAFSSPREAVSDPVAAARVDEWKTDLHEHLHREIDKRGLKPAHIQTPEFRATQLKRLRELITQNPLAGLTPRDALVYEKQVLDEMLGYGPMQDLLSDPTVNEVMVVDRSCVYFEREGRLRRSTARFSSDNAVLGAIQKIVVPLGRRIDTAEPMVDARLKDGSRVNAVIPPLALRGPCITIRKFSVRSLTLDDLQHGESINRHMARFLRRCVQARRNIIVSGGTGSGKTTLLNILSAAIPENERIVTIEDAAELRLAQPHVVSLETRPKNQDGKGLVTIANLVRNALRMRPDRIIVGECRDEAAFDMLQAMNTGHEGSMTTLHANSCREAIDRLVNLVQGGRQLPMRAIQQQVAASIHLIVQQRRFSSGERKITEISEVTGYDDDDGIVRLEPIFEFHRLPSVAVPDRARPAPDKVHGEFIKTGYLPTFLEDFVTLGLIDDGEVF